MYFSLKLENPNYQQAGSVMVDRKREQIKALFTQQKKYHSAFLKSLQNKTVFNTEDTELVEFVKSIIEANPGLKEYIKTNLKLLDDETKTALEFKNVRECSVEELMTLNDYDTTCNNITRVTGSCGDPSFLKSNKEISEDSKNNWIRLLDTIKSKLSERETFEIILGAINPDEKKSGFSLSNIELYADEASDYKSLDECITKINDRTPGAHLKIFFKNYFPLSHNFPNSIEVLNKVLEMKPVRLRLTNRMCGTCHRSLYYLVQKGVDYIVNPDQGLNPTLDTDEIRNCFKLTYNADPLH